MYLFTPHLLLTLYQATNNVGAGDTYLMCLNKLLVGECIVACGGWYQAEVAVRHRSLRQLVM